MSFQIPRIAKALLAVVLTAAFAGFAAAASRDQLPTYPRELSPAGMRALASQTQDPELLDQLRAMLPDGALEAARDYVRETRALGLDSRSGRIPILSASPTNVNANTNHVGDVIGETQAEIAVAVHGDTVVVGWNDSRGFAAGNTVSSYGFSTDGGATFIDGGNVPLAAAGDQASGDPGIDTDQDGNWYYNQIYTRPGPTQQNIGVHGGRFNGVGALVWNSPVMASIGTSATGNLDKCLLACDRVTGNVYVSYTRFTAIPQIEIVRSTTLGASWGAPIVLDNTSTPTASKQSARPFCGPGGEVYVVWEKGANVINCPDGLGDLGNPQGQIAFTRSLDFGATYSPFTIIGMPDLTFMASGPGDLRERGNEFPDIAVDRSGLGTNGNIYVTWHQAATWTSNLAAGPAVPEASDAANNNPGGAELFTIGDDVTGTIGATADLDYWLFSATQGQSLLMNLDPNTFNCGITGAGSASMRMRLFATQSPYPNPNGFPDTLLAASAQGAFADRIVWTAPKTGNYLVRLQRAGGLAAPYPYRLRVRPLGFAANPARDARDVVVVRSTDMGTTWTSPQLVNDDPAGLENNRPFISVDGLGHVHAFWHDHRDAGLGSNAALTSIYGTTSRDAGVSWTPNYQVTDQLSFFSFNTLAVPNLGDYNMAASSGPVTHAGWSDQRLSTGDVRVPNANTFSAGLGPEAYTAKVIYDFTVVAHVNGPNARGPVLDSETRTFTIENTGTVPDAYDWVATDTQSLLIGPTSGSTGVLQPGATTDVTVTVDAADCNSDIVTLTVTPVGDADGSKSAVSMIDPAVIAAVSTTIVICPTQPCVTLPVNLTRTCTTGVLGFSVTIQLSANLSRCAPGSITEGTFLSSVGPTTFQIVDNGGGSYTVDGAILANCGSMATSGNLFNVGVTSSDPDGTGSITVTVVKLRDCANVPLAVAPGPPGTVPIDNQAPMVTVLSPDGGESWSIGSSQKLGWIATDNVSVASVDIAYSTDGGATFPNPIASGIVNTGTFAWTVPNMPTTQARVRITAHDDGCLSGSDDSDANFTIFEDVTCPSVRVDMPNGGETVFIGQQVKLAWTATDDVGVTSIDLYISRDNGATQEKIASGIPNTGTTIWTVTGPGTNPGPNPVFSALLTAVAHDAAGNSDCSDVSDLPWAIFDLVTATVLAKFQANAVDDGVELRWRITGDALAAVALERSDQESGPWSAVNAEVRIEGDESVVIDRSVTAGRDYFYRLAARSSQGQAVTFGPLLGSAGVSVKEFGFASVTPNPSFGPVHIEYTVPKEVAVELSVLDLQGRVLAVLSEGSLRPGRYQTVWSGETSRGAAPAGIYFLRLQAAGKNVVRRIVLGR